MNNEQQKRAAETIRSLVANPQGIAWLRDNTSIYTVGILWFDLKVRDVGSGVLVQFEGEHFLATCSHVLRQDHADRTPILYYGQSEITDRDRELFFESSRIALSDDEGASDIGLVRLKPSAAQFITNSYNLHFASLQELAAEPETGLPCFVVGVPSADLEEHVSIGEDEVPEIDHKVVTRILEARYVDGLGGRIRLERTGHHWPSLGGFPHGVGGMSGGGIWQLHATLNGNQYAAQPPPVGRPMPR